MLVKKKFKKVQKSSLLLAKDSLKYLLDAHPRVVKLVDAVDSKSTGSDTVSVQVRPRGPIRIEK